jgi:lipopolysaccharide transport system permease protein
MSRVVYTSNSQAPVAKLISPYWILRDLLTNRELIVAYTKREFEATHRGTYLGLAWTVVSPLIMLALFVGVFGYIFHGRFTQDPNETAGDYALALFVGLAFFNCFSQSMGSAPGLVLANRTYVKTLAFPLEILSVSAVLNVLANLLISLGLCFAGFLVMYGYIHWSAVSLILHVACVALLSLGVSWLLSALSVFVRDIPPIIAPLSLILMFSSSVFFPLSAVPARVRWVVKLNPLAVIIDEARSCFLYGQWPDFASLGLVFVFSLLFAILGYWFFMRSKPAFADVI